MTFFSTGRDIPDALTESKMTFGLFSKSFRTPRSNTMVSYLVWDEGLLCLIKKL